MTNSWSDCRLSDIAELSGGYAFKSQDYQPSGRFVLRTVNIGSDYQTSRDGGVFVSEQVASDKARFELRPHDTLFVMVGATLGKIGFVREDVLPALLNQNMWRIRAREEIADSVFVHYLFRHAVKQNLGLASGSARDFVRRDDYRNLSISLPSLPEQRAIAHVLGTLDDKIELNRKMNETLEELARAIFKSWFVDFDPVKAKAEGRQPVGMDAETSALFPDSFEDSELGQIPAGWNATLLENEFNITMGQSPPGSSYNEVGDGIPFFQGRRDFGTRFPSVRVYCTDPKRFANENDTLLSVRAPVGDINIADRKCCIGRGLASIRHKSGAVSYTFGVARQLQQRLNVFEGEGTVFGSINRKELGSLSICEPPKSVLDMFDSTYGSLDDLIRQNTEESSTLIELRDTLLPRLISGKLRIPDAERLLAEAQV